MVIYIHGIGVRPPKEQWKRECDLALFGKPMGERTSMAYWSDILHGPSSVATLRARALDARTGDGKTADEIDLDAILKDVSVPAAKRPAAAAQLERIAKSLARVEVIHSPSRGRVPTAVKNAPAGFRVVVLIRSSQLSKR